MTCRGCEYEPCICTQVYELDFDKDGLADIIVRDTNGHTIYVSVKWFVAAVSAMIVTVSGALYYVF